MQNFKELVSLQDVSPKIISTEDIKDFISKYLQTVRLLRNKCFIIII